MSTQFKSRGKVLLAVQGEIFQQGLQVYFRQWGFEPLLLNSSKPDEWQQVIRTQHPLLLVADYSKTEEVTLLVEQQANFPIILLVAQELLPKNVFDSLHHFLSKPCSISELKETVSQLLIIPFPM